MRKTSPTLAALALMLAGSLTAVAEAANLERDHRQQRADQYVAQTIAPASLAQRDATVADALARRLV